MTRHREVRFGRDSQEMNPSTHPHLFPPLPDYLLSFEAVTWKPPKAEIPPPKKKTQSHRGTEAMGASGNPGPAPTGGGGAPRRGAGAAARTRGWRGAWLGSAWGAGLSLRTGGWMMRVAAISTRRSAHRQAWVDAAPRGAGEVKGPARAALRALRCRVSQPCNQPPVAGPLGGSEPRVLDRERGDLRRG